MSDNKDKENRGFSLGSAFKDVGGYIRENKVQAGALAASLTVGADILLGTSALTPYITHPLVAATAFGTSIGLLIQNGKTTVHNTLALGSKWALSAMTLGLIVGSLNTIPETAVSVNSVLQGALDLGTGNVIGSSIAHMLVILGIPALAMGISKAKDLSWKFNTYVMAGTAALFGSQLLMGTFSPLIGAAMLGIGGYYLYKRFCTGEQKHKHEHSHDHGHEHHHDHHHDDEDELSSCAFHDHGDDDEIKEIKKYPTWLNATLAGSGMLGLIAASSLIVSSGISIAEHFNFAVSGVNLSLGQAGVGALFVAIGTAIPEIAISIEAIRKKHSDLAIGNVLGCSIINTLVAGGILSMTGLIDNFSWQGLVQGVAVPSAFTLDNNLGLLNTGFFLGTTALLTGTLLATQGAVKRWMGGTALTLYGAYIFGSLVLNDGKMPDTHQHHTMTDTEVIQIEEMNLGRAKPYEGVSFAVAPR